MLRITDYGQNSSGRTVKLEGKLLQPWVAEVRNLFVASGPEPFPSLDLSGLSYVDRPGAEMLRQLVQQGVSIELCSPFVAELLHWECKPNR